jgi:hypothetical protein
MTYQHYEYNNQVDSRTVMRAANAIMDYRADNGLRAVSPPSFCKLHCRDCEWSIGAQPHGDAEFDPIKLMAIAEKYEVTIKLTATLNDYVVCILPWQGEALIYG